MWGEGTTQVSSSCTWINSSSLHPCSHPAPSPLSLRSVEQLGTSLTLHCSHLCSGSAFHSSKSKVLTVIHKPFHPPIPTVAFAPAHTPPTPPAPFLWLSHTPVLNSLGWITVADLLFPNYSRGRVPTLGLCTCSGYSLELSSPGCLTAQLPHSSTFTQVPPPHCPLPGHPSPRHELTNTNS